MAAPSSSQFQLNDGDFLWNSTRAAKKPSSARARGGVAAASRLMNNSGLTSSQRGCGVASAAAARGGGVQDVLSNIKCSSLNNVKMNVNTTASGTRRGTTPSPPAGGSVSNQRPSSSIAMDIQQRMQKLQAGRVPMSQRTTNPPTASSSSGASPARGHSQLRTSWHQQGHHQSPRGTTASARPSTARTVPSKGFGSRGSAIGANSKKVVAPFYAQESNSTDTAFSKKSDNDQRSDETNQAAPRPPRPTAGKPPRPVSARAAAFSSNVPETSKPSTTTLPAEQSPANSQPSTPTTSTGTSGRAPGLNTPPPPVVQATIPAQLRAMLRSGQQGLSRGGTPTQQQRPSSASGGSAKTQQLRQRFAEGRNVVLLLIETICTKLRRHVELLSADGFHSSSATTQRVLSILAWTTADEPTLRKLLNSEMADLGQKAIAKVTTASMHNGGNADDQTDDDNDVTLLPQVLLGAFVSIGDHLIEALKLAVAYQDYCLRHFSTNGSSSSGSSPASETHSSSSSSFLFAFLTDPALRARCDEHSDVAFVAALQERLKKMAALCSSNEDTNTNGHVAPPPTPPSATLRLLALEEVELPLFHEWRKSSEVFAKRKFGSESSGSSGEYGTDGSRYNQQNPKTMPSPPESGQTTPRHHSTSPRSHHQQQSFGKSTAFNRWRSRPNSAPSAGHHSNGGGSGSAQYMRGTFKYTASTGAEQPPPSSVSNGQPPQPHNHAIINMGRQFVQAAVMEEASWNDFERKMSSSTNSGAVSSSQITAASAPPPPPFPHRSLQILDGFARYYENLHAASLLLQRSPLNRSMADHMKLLQRRWHPDKFQRWSSTLSLSEDVDAAKKARLMQDATTMAQRINALKEAVQFTTAAAAAEK